MDFAIPANLRLKLKEYKKWDKHLDLARELKKTKERESSGDTICDWRAQYRHQNIATGNWRLGNKRTSGDHPNDSIIEIGQYTKKNLRDLRRLAVTQNLAENHHLTLMWKTLTWAK